jgi:hypothetical protein
MKKIFSLLPAILIASSALAGQCTDKWKEPYTGATLGGKLEKLFGDSLAACHVPPIKRVTSMFSSCSSEVSAIPILLQQKLDLNSPVAWNDRQSLARHFAFIYPSKNIYGSPDAEDKQWLLYDDPLPSSPISLIDRNGSNVVYSYDCGLSIAAALDASYNLKIGLAETGAALKSTYNSKEKTSIVLASAQFDSPLLKMWNSVSPQEQVQAGMRFYSWYRRHKEESSDLWLLSSIKEGVATYNLIEETKNFGGVADFKASANAAVATAGFNLNTSANEAIGTKITGFAVATKNGKQQFEKLPSPKEIVDRFTTLRTTLLDDDYTAIPGSRVKHTQSLLGLESKFCDDKLALWDIKSDDSNIKLIGLKANEINGIANCDFTVEYNVPLKYINKDEVQEFILDYKFIAKQTMEDKSGGNLTLSISAAPVRHVINRSPYIFSVNLATRPEHEDNTKSLAWKGTLVFRDNSKLIDWGNPIAADNFIINCIDKSGGLPVSVTVAINTAQQTADAMVRYDTGSDRDYQALKATDEYQRCSLIGNVSFSTKPSGNITRPVAFPFIFPKAKAIPTPAATATIVAPNTLSANSQ